MKAIETETAPAAIGPYSQAMVYGGLVYTSGQIPVVPETGNVVGDSIEAQAEQSCKMWAQCLLRRVLAMSML